jgi:hypothetical protein
VVDRNAGRSECVLRREATIETPTDYVNLINNSSVRSNITWIEMEQHRFKCYSKWLRSKYADRRKDVNGQPFRFSDMVHFNFGVGERINPTDGTLNTFRHPGVVWMRKTLDPLEPPVEVDFRKEQRRRNLSSRTLSTLNKKNIKLSDSKCKDLLSLSKYLSPRGKEYYRSIVGDK